MKTGRKQPDGLWEFIQLPFGGMWGGGPATFQRVTETILSGLAYDACLCYFDDTIIPSTRLEQQCERLSAVLSRFVNKLFELRLKSAPLELPMLHFLAMLFLLKGCILVQKKFKLCLHFLSPPLLNKLDFSLDLQDTNFSQGCHI